MHIKAQGGVLRQAPHRRAMLPTRDTEIVGLAMHDKTDKLVFRSRELVVGPAGGETSEHDRTGEKA
jgi:hypothetical protein